MIDLALGPAGRASRTGPARRGGDRGAAEVDGSSGRGAGAAGAATEVSPEKSMLRPPKRLGRIRRLASPPRASPVDAPAVQCAVCSLTQVYHDAHTPREYRDGRRRASQRRAAAGSGVAPPSSSSCSRCSSQTSLTLNRMCCAPASASSPKRSTTWRRRLRRRRRRRGSIADRPGAWSARSRRTAARRPRSAPCSTCHLWWIFSGPPKTFVASAYCATRRSVFCSPPPPIMIGTRGREIDCGELSSRVGW